MAQTFRAGNKVGWKSSALPGYGSGPFKVLKVTAAELNCPHSGRKRHRDVKNCPDKYRAHPQSVAIGDWETGKFLTVLSGAYLKKV